MEQGSLGCAEVLGLVTDYLDGALPPGRHRAVAGHLGACAGCSGWVSQLLATIAALSCLRDGVIPAPVLAALRESFAGVEGLRRESGCSGGVPTGSGDPADLGDPAGSGGPAGSGDVPTGDGGRGRRT
ncbi:hypothetical protein FXF51_27615 [Nonomuraea sp. PA05]|uniref:anti-sigma factor family protein n=1 Tax=Nonomuraea sp. PA05 TaxID=2604466 RepID=UPI0011D85B29|nr:hypothetical protein FXF51_27615 [Nonomuraea sp. PA05]